MAAAEPCSAEHAAGGSDVQATAMAAGIIAHVPNEQPRFVPIAAGTLACGLAEVAVRLRSAVRAAFFGEQEEEEDYEGKLAEEEDEEEDGFRLLYREKDLDDEICAATFLKAMSAGHPCVVRVLFRLLGGKGGFGALLRGQKGRGKKTVNMDSMRDLSGRRLRHSKAVERIKEWMEKQKREDEVVAALTGEGPELPKPVPQAESLDPEFVRRLKRAAADKPGLVNQGMRKLQAENAAAGKEEEEEEEAPKRKRREVEGPAGGGPMPADVLDALNMLEGLSSPDGEDEQEPEAAPLTTVEGMKLGTVLRVLSDSAIVTAAGTEAGLSEDMWQQYWEASAGKLARVVQIDSENLQLKCRVPGVREVWFPASALVPLPSDGEAAWAKAEMEDAPEAPESGGAAASSASASSSAPQSSAAAAASGSAAAPRSNGAAAGAAAASTAAASATAAASSAAASSSTADGSKPAAATAAAGAAAPTGGAKAAAAAPPAKPIRPEDVKKYKSAEELGAKVSAEVLKATLQQLGMKCGGKPEERAARLFLLKDKALGDLPKSVFAAKPK